jgi:hypothetical protein
VAKLGWRLNGGRQDILAWVTDAYVKRYGSTMRRFLADSGWPEIVPRPLSDPDYSYLPVGGRQSLPKVQRSVELRRSNVKAEGVRTVARPIIWRNFLDTQLTLDIQIMDQRYVLPHDELVTWVGDHTNALKTRSWLVDGIYSWPRPSRDMSDFLERYYKR